MAYYRTCPLCGAALDPGETCDCEYIVKSDYEEETRSERTEDYDYATAGRDLN